jgi:hypothetical protein
MAYKSLIEKLDEDTLYSPSLIARFAEEHGLLPGGDTRAPLQIKKQRIRIALGRFSNNHDFPDEGDGMVTIRGQAPTPGWYGWRWQAALIA